MIERKDIPLGFTFDEFGNVLTFKDRYGYWYEYTRDQLGNTLTKKDSKGYWHEYTRDSNGNILTYKDSNGYWYEYTRDANGKILTKKDSKGEWLHITKDDSYDLYVETNTGEIIAGCRQFKTVEAALKHWNRNDERAKIFTAALKKHFNVV